ncbi:MAG: hypothetical protein L0I76_32070 [Pseudonocardia sp.]|nr:hypothetical protein [Pseudonocardia sp.]
MSILTDTLTTPAGDAPTGFCPPWCTLAGHSPALDPIDGTTLVEHRGTVLPDAAGHSIELVETVETSAAGTARSNGPRLIIDGRSDEALSVDEARQFLAGLALAAELATGGAR